MSNQSNALVIDAELKPKQEGRRWRFRKLHCKREGQAITIEEKTATNILARVFILNDCNSCLIITDEATSYQFLEFTYGSGSTRTYLLWPDGAAALQRLLYPE